MRYFIELAYNGKAYHGWQNQPNAITVQQVLEKTFTLLLKETITITGAGRTDTGVHASQMFAHFDVSTAILDTEQLVFKLNSFLPKDIAIARIFQVKEDAHARFDAISRTYRYRIATKKNPFSYDEAYYFKQDLDVALMNSAAKVLLGYSDFKSFSRSNSDVKTYNCKIRHAQWSQKENELHFVITADRFLRNMVRAIVGTLLDIGTYKCTIEELHAILASRDRSQAGASAPAHGLYLTKIEYPERIIK